jgi:hypothetical protein
MADFARLYRTQITSEHLAEYVIPASGISLDAVIAELETRTKAGDET